MTEIAGALRRLEGNASFAVAPAVAKHATSPTDFVLLSQVHTRHTEVITSLEWQAFLQAGEAFELGAPEHGVDPPAEVWLFRGSDRWAEEITELREATEPAHGEPTRIGAVTYCVVKHGAASERLRDQWSDRAFNQAYARLREPARWAEALALAIDAHLLASTWRPRLVGLRCALLEATGDAAAARSWIGVAGRSCGESFARDADRECRELSSRMAAAQPMRPKILDSVQGVRNEQKVDKAA